MVVGRVVGWGLVALAVLMAGGDAVMALGAVHAPTIATGDLFTLVTGVAPDPAQGGGMLLRLPAWVVAGVTGGGLCATCRRRSRRYWFRR